MIVIDLLNPELEIVSTQPVKVESENKDTEVMDRSKTLRLQVISITGELVDVEY